MPEQQPAPDRTLDCPEGIQEFVTLAATGSVLSDTLPTSVPGYELLAEVGRGGMGVVYKARHVQLDRVVALKMVLAGSHAGPAELARFRQEAETVARLAHPNIVQIYEVGSHAGLSYLALEYVEGGSLAQKTAGIPQPSHEAARLVELVARAVDHAHQKGIVHRDLTPGNVLLSAEGAPKLTDFGLARRTHDPSGMTATGAIVGTPGYLAPEQARGDGSGITPATDVYALGAILYYLLTGRPPFQAATALDAILQTIEKEPIPPRQLQPGTPRDLETICLKCLQKDPARRYGSAALLADDLGRFLADEPIRARPAGTAGRLVRWVKRNPAVAGLLGAVAASLLVGTAVATYFAIEADARAREAQSEKVRADEKTAEAEANATRAAEEAGKARRNLYLAQLNLAEHAWHDGQPAQTLHWLGQIASSADRTDFRRFEFHQLERLCRPELDRLQLDGQVMAVAFSPDGRTLAAASAQSGVRLWDTATRRETARLPGGASHVAFHPDGRRLATANMDKHVRLWDGKKGQELRILKGHSHPVRALAFSPDGKLLISTSKGRFEGKPEDEVVLWDVDGGRLLKKITDHPGLIDSVAYSPDGRFLALASDSRMVQVRDAATGRPLRNLDCQDNVNRVTFSADGWLAVACGNNYRIPADVKIFNPSDGRLLRRLQGHAALVWDMAFSRDGKRLASASGDNTVKIWDAATGRELHTFRDTNWVFGVAFSPDGRLVASGGNDGMVKLWDSGGDQEPRLLGSNTRFSVWDPVFSPDGRRLASIATNVVLVWDTVTGLELFRVRGQGCVAMSPDGRFFASLDEDRAVVLRDARTGRKVRAFRGPLAPFINTAWAVHSLAFSADGQRLLAVGGDGLIRTWDLTSGQEGAGTRLGRLSESVFPRLSPDAQYVVLYDYGQRVAEIRRTATGELVRNLQVGLGVIQFSPGGQWYAVADGHSVTVFESTTGRKKHTLVGHSNSVSAVAFSPDGQRLAAGGLDGTVRLWELHGGQLLRTLRGHSVRVFSVAFSPDGFWLVSTSDDGLVKLWDGRPPSDDLRVEREAGALLGWLHAGSGTRRDALARLQADLTISHAVRRRAMALAPLYAAAQLDREAYRLVEDLGNRPLLREEILQELRRQPGGDEAVRQKALAFAEHYPYDPMRLNEASRKVVRQAGRDPGEYKRALRLAEVACRLAPDNGILLTTLGVAYYRTKQWQLALETLSRSERLNAKLYGASIPADLAFLALACHQLGQKDRARAYLTRLRAAVKDWLWVKDKEAQDFLREAEELMGAKSP